MNKSLDPKLRRLATSTKARDLDRLRRDAAAGAVFSTEGLAAEELDSESAVSVRALAMLKGGMVPKTHGELQWTRIVGNVFAVDVPVTALESLAEQVEVQFLEMGRGFAPFLDTSLPETRADEVHTPTSGQAYTGNGVVVGIIDYGLDYRLDDFRNADGTTRVAFLWDQSLTPQGHEVSPANFPYGVEYDRASIDDALQGNRQIRHAFGVESHGTHVAGIAAGNGRSNDGTFLAATYIGAAPDATIVFVQPSTRNQQSTFTDSVNVSEAIAYVFARAAELDLPCVINMSLGQNGGSHDGESVVERAIDQLLETPGRAFVSAAGNEHTWRGHASGQLAQGDTRVLRWKMGGGIPWPASGGTPLPQGAIGDFTTNEMEIWSSSRDELRVRVNSPGGDTTNWVRPGESNLLTLPNNNTVFVDSERFTVLNGDSRVYIEVSPPTNGLVEAGEWEVEIEAETVREGRFDAYIERDVRRHIIQLPSGSFANFFADQSFFLGTDFDPEQTLGTPATARRSIAVANYDHNTQDVVGSSSRGPTRDGRRKPEVAAPGANIVSSSSGAGDATAAGGVVPARTTKTGTSMSAPHVTGIVALMLERQPELSAPQIQRILATAARETSGVTGFDNSWGFGMVDARGAVDLVS